jgi:hypothetical protein
MTEPATTAAATGVSLVTLASTLLGPQFGPLLGPYLVIVLCSTVGAQWAILASPTMTRMDALLLMLRVSATAVVLTAMLAQLVGSYFNVPVNEAYGAISFFIGALGHRWMELIDGVKQRLLAIISRTGGNP